MFYGWFIVGVGLLAYAFGYGGRYSFSVILPSLLNEFQWPRGNTGAILSAHFLAYGFTAPLAGYCVDKVGPRKTMVVGTMTFSLGLIASGSANTLWNFYLGFGVLSGMGLCLMGAVPFTIILKNWFERKRGRALSILWLGVGGGFAWYPAVALIIEHEGWRKAFVFEGLIISAVLVPLIILFIRYEPQEKGLMPDGAPEGMGIGETTRRSASYISFPSTLEWTLAKAIKSRRFWLMCLTTFSAWGVGQHIVIAHQVAYLIDLGYSTIYASSVLSLFGIFFAVGALSAAVCDRIGREATMTLAILIILSSISMLMLMKDDCRPWMLGYYAIAFGFGLGMTNPTIAATAIDIFRGPRIGGILGFIWFSFSMGGALGPWIGGWIFEVTKSYILAFVLAQILFVISCVAVWFAAPRKVCKFGFG